MARKWGVVRNRSAVLGLVLAFAAVVVVTEQVEFLLFRPRDRRCRCVRDFGPVAVDFGLEYVCCRCVRDFGCELGWVGVVQNWAEGVVVRS